MTDELSNALVDIASTPAQVAADPFTHMVERLATNQEVDAEKLEKLVDIQMRILDRNAEAEFHAAMALVQAKIPDVANDSYNDQTKSGYTKLRAIVRAIRPIYTNYGFSVSFSQGQCDRDGYIRVDGTLSHSGGHTVPSFIELPLDDKGIKGSTNKTGVHASGSTFSYARRYLTLMMFNVSTGDDDDAQGASDYSTTLTDDEIEELQSLATRLFPGKGARVLASLARARFRFDDGDFTRIPSYRFRDAVVSLQEKADEENEDG